MELPSAPGTVQVTVIVPAESVAEIGSVVPVQLCALICPAISCAMNVAGGSVIIHSKNPFTLITAPVFSDDEKSISAPDGTHVTPWYPFASPARVDATVDPLSPPGAVTVYVKV